MDDVSRKSRRRYARFFGELGNCLEGARQADHRRTARFFAELSPRLDTARALERQLDRQLARRFNAFDYVDTSETGLSRIIADLLNPAGRHGQGTLFLETLLAGLVEIRDRPALNNSLTKPVRVTTERGITNQRRLDISVEIPDNDGMFCLVIENKPYAGDQHRQVHDYLEFLKRRYSKRFLLIYLSPTGEGPEERSLPRDELDRWSGRFAVMPYHHPEGVDWEGVGDGFDDFRVGLSLTEWLAACRRRCEADRLRWFLGEAEIFCLRNSGGHSMPTDSEAQALREYLLSNPDHLVTAQTVHDAWPATKAHLCKGFLEHLHTTVRRRVMQDLHDDSADIRVEYAYGWGSKGYSYVWLYRVGWRPWENHTNEPPPEGCTAILLQGFPPGPNKWIRGVRHPLHRNNLTDSDKARSARLAERLRLHLDAGESRDWWPYVRQVSDEKANWNALLPDLYREWKAGEGPLTDYYVDGLMDIATKAIPIIDEVEREFEAQSG